MQNEFAGEALDGLLNVLVELGGDQLSLQTNAEPVARLGERKLRVTLPETSNATLQTLCGRMALTHKTSSVGRPSVFTYQSKGHGAFSVEIDGDFAPDATVKIRLRRLAGQTRPGVISGLAAGTSTALPLGSPSSAAPTSFASPSETRTAVGSPAGEATQRFVASMAGSGLAPSESARSVAAVELSLTANSEAAHESGETQPLQTAAHANWTSDLEISTLLRQAIDVGATDLHLTDGQSPRLRCAGGLVNAGPRFDGVSRLLTAHQRRSVEAGHALDLSVSFEAQTRLRVNVFRSEWGLCAAIRFLPLRPPSLESLGLPSELLALGELSNGLVLICGTTGSGKSTTLAALLQDRLRKRSRHVITLENPIEYLMDSGDRSLVRQREVPRHVPTFAAGLRDALREDPDELVIGEMRDADTIGLALTAAETGHLVWSSLHSRTARSAIERIVDQVSPTSQRQVRGQLADSLRAVVSQRLVRAEGDGGRGFAGQPRPVVAAEVLTVTPAVAHLIREGKTEQLAVAIHSGKDAGMLPLEKDLARLVKQGKLTRAVARAQADDAALFDRYA